MRYRPPRLPSDLGVTLVSGGKRHRARIVNVSQTGALVAGPEDIGVGARVDLVATSLRLSARVVRADPAGLALRFATELSKSDLTRLRRAVHRGGAGAESRPVHRFREL
jgi:hypothetical protein